MAEQKAFIFFANVRDHRWLPVARLVPGEERTQARGVTRVAIRWIALFALFSLLSVTASAGKIFWMCSESDVLRKRHPAEEYFCGVGVMAKGGIKPKPRFGGREYISARFAPLQIVGWKSCPLRLGRITLGVIPEISNVTWRRFLE